ILPKPDRPIRPAERWLLRHVPAVQRLRRYGHYWYNERLALGISVAPSLMRYVERMATRHMRAQVADPVLREHLTPSYRAGCKRILLSNDYYLALNRPNVEVIPAAVADIDEHSVGTAKGVRRTVDAVVLATGFRVSDLLGPLQVRGRDGV